MSAELVSAKLQRDVKDAIVAFGGDLAPLAASSRILEHAIALAEGEPAAPHVRDLLLLSTCLANQYCAELTGRYPSTTTATSMESLLGAARRCAELVGAYEGSPVAAKPGGDAAGAIDALHRALVARATDRGVDIHAAVADLEAALRATLRVDAPRALRVRTIPFDDPTLAPCLTRFVSIKTRTQCSFARAARLWGAPAFRSDLTLEENVEGLIPVLRRFVRVTTGEFLDGFIFEAPGREHGDSTAALARTTRRVLTHLSERDPRHWHVLRRDPADPRWFFAFDGLPLYLLTFAPCYPIDHANYGFGNEATHFFFQPYESIAHRVAREPLRNTGVHASIRERYAQAGRTYDWAHAQVGGEIGQRDALRFVKPLSPDAELVRWWLPDDDRRS